MSVFRFSLTFLSFCILQATAISDKQSPQISRTTEMLANVLLKATSGNDFNYVAAPFAGSVILALTAEGAETETKSQLIEAMGGELPDKSSYKSLLTSIKGYSSEAQNRPILKNFLYVYKNYSVHDSFAELARDYYLTDVRTVARPDLDVVRAGHGGSAAVSDDNETAKAAFKEHAMLMFNGFSLEMSWPTSTWHKTSVSWNGNVVQAFGAAGNFAIGYISNLDCTIFQLPYKNTDYAMLILLPKKKDTTLDGVLEKLSETNLEKQIKSMSMKPAFVTMPCFKSSNITHLKTVLQENTQVKTVFASSADLSKMSLDHLYLDDVVQQAGVSVCTDGASSYSLTSSAFTSQRVIKESIVVDRPFLYAIYNTVNNVIYATGKLEQPVWEQADETADSGPDDSDVEAIEI